jgi:hypothetical protein
MTIELAQSDFNQIMENARVKGRLDYSGRGMFGETCVAIVGSIQDLMRLTRELDRYATTLTGMHERYSADPYDSGIDAWELNTEEELDAVRGFQEVLESDLKQDEMGKELVFYWPGVQVLT